MVASIAPDSPFADLVLRPVAVPTPTVAQRKPAEAVVVPRLARQSAAGPASPPPIEPDNPFADLVPSSADAPTPQVASTPQSAAQPASPPPIEPDNPFADLVPMRPAEAELAPRRRVQPVSGPPVKGLGANIRAGFEAGLAGIPESEAGFVEALAGYLGSQGALDLAESMRRLSPRIAAPPKFWESPQDWLAYQGAQGLASFLPSVAGFVGGGLAGGALGSAVGGPAGATVGAAAGGLIGGGATAASQNIGDLYNELVDAGVDPDRARDVAVIGGSIITIPDVFGLERVMKPITGAAREKLIKDAAQSIAKRMMASAKAGFRAGAIEAITEGVQEALQASIVAEETGRQPSAAEFAERVGGAAVGGFVPGTVFGTVHGYRELGREVREREQRAAAQQGPATEIIPPPSAPAPQAGQQAADQPGPVIEVIPAPSATAPQAGQQSPAAPGAAPPPGAPAVEEPVPQPGAAVTPVPQPEAAVTPSTQPEQPGAEQVATTQEGIQQEPVRQPVVPTGMPPIGATVRVTTDAGIDETGAVEGYFVDPEGRHRVRLRFPDMPRPVEWRTDMINMEPVASPPGQAAAVPAEEQPAAKQPPAQAEADQPVAARPAAAVPEEAEPSGVGQPVLEARQPIGPAAEEPGAGPERVNITVAAPTPMAQATVLRRAALALRDQFGDRVIVSTPAGGRPSLTISGGTPEEMAAAQAEVLRQQQTVAGAQPAAIVPEEEEPHRAPQPAVEDEAPSPVEANESIGPAAEEPGAGPERVNITVAAPTPMAQATVLRRAALALRDQFGDRVIVSTPAGGRPSLTISGGTPEEMAAAQAEVLRQQRSFSGAAQPLAGGRADLEARARAVGIKEPESVPEDELARLVVEREAIAAENEALNQEQAANDRRLAAAAPEVMVPPEDMAPSEEMEPPAEAAPPEEVAPRAEVPDERPVGAEDRERPEQGAAPREVPENEPAEGPAERPAESDREPGTPERAVNQPEAAEAAGEAGRAAPDEGGAAAEPGGEVGVAGQAPPTAAAEPGRESAAEETENAAAEDIPKPDEGSVPTGARYETLEAVRRAVQSGELQITPERRRKCYAFASDKAIAEGHNYVIGQVGGPRNVWHAVAQTTDGRWIYEPQYDAWVPADLYPQLVGGWAPVMRMSAQEVLDFGQRTGMYPSPFTLAEAGEWRAEPAAMPAETVAAEPAGKIPARPVKDDTALMPDGREVAVRYAIVELDDVIASHTDVGSLNPRYPAEFQPRDRARAASQAQIVHMAAHLQPRRLGESATIGEGAPIIAPDGVVESGNGRIIALKRAYREGTAEGYRQFLAQQGYPVEGMRQPVLVRIRTEPMTREQRLEFVRAGNDQDKLELSVTEQAMIDARRLSDTALSKYRGGDIDAAANADFRRAFSRDVLNENERGKFIDLNGEVSVDGRRRMQAALVAKAYGDGSLVSTLFEVTDSNIRAIGNALTSVSALWAQMRSQAAARQINPEVDITANLLEAVNIVRHARQLGRSIAEFAHQANLLEGGKPPSDRAVMFLRIFYRGEDFSRARSQERVEEALSHYIEQATETKPTAGLFGQADITSPDQILETVLGRVERNDAARQQAGLFDQKPPAGPADGERPGPAGGQGPRPVGEDGRQEAEAERPAGDRGRQEPEQEVEAKQPQPEQQPGSTLEELRKRVAEAKTKGKPKQSGGVPRVRKERAKAAAREEAKHRIKEASKELGRESVKALDEAAAAITKLLGGVPGRLSSGIGFDEDTYRAMKPHLAAMMQHLRRAGQSINELLDAVRDYLISYWTDEQIEVGLPYVARFIDETLAAERPAPQPKPAQRPTPEPAPPPEDRPLTDAQVLKNVGLTIEKMVAKSGREYWAVRANNSNDLFETYKAILDQLGFANPRKDAKGWLRAFFEHDPTPALAALLRGQELPDTSPPRDLPNLSRADAEVALRKAGISIATSPDGSWLVTGRTYQIRDLLRQLGGRWDDGPGKIWRFRNDPTEELGSAVAARAAERRDGRRAQDDPDASRRSAEEIRLRQLRQREDTRPDERWDDAIARQHVSADTAALLRRGVEAGIPEEVVDDQIADVGLIKRAFEAGKPAFILANEAGTGKTFVLGGAIRELRQMGVRRFVYVTMNQDLIAQVKRDLAEYGAEAVDFYTFAELSKGPTRFGRLTGEEVLIFDESHNIKNVGSGNDDGSRRGKAAKALISSAKFTIFSSATPFENPVEAQYLEATGVFLPVGGWAEWAKAYGAAVRRRRFFDYSAGREIVDEIIYWPGRGKKEDGAAARAWLMKQGIMTQRLMHIDPDLVDVQFRRREVDQRWVDLYQKLERIYAEAARIWSHENGAPIDNKVYSQIAQHRENVIKRVLEASKVDFAIERAKTHLAEGKNVVIFVETKADRELGLWRRSGQTKDDKLYTFAEMQRIMAEWDRDLNTARAMGSSPPPRPFAEFIYSLAEIYNKHGLRIDLPSTADLIAEALGPENVAIYTGAISATQAARNKDDFMSGKKRVLVATMAKGGTGLSLHDRIGNRPTVQINLNLPWKATSVDQVAGRVARYGLRSKALIEWLFASNIPWEIKKLAPRVGARMRDMGAIVKGIEVRQAELLDSSDFDFEGVLDVRQLPGEGVIEVEDEGHFNDYARAWRLEQSRRPPDDTSGGFFETPFPLAVVMDRLASLTAGERVLEPSAGTGNLLRFITPRVGAITAIERSSSRSEQLKANLEPLSKSAEVEVINRDFLEWHAEQKDARYDVVLMNPPFERVAGEGWQDITHVMAAYDHLRDGGRLIAIMSEGPFFRSDKQSEAFRMWLDRQNATVIQLPEEAFKKSGTNVRTRMVVIDNSGRPGRTDLQLADMDPRDLERIERLVPPRDGESVLADDVAFAVTEDEGPARPTPSEESPPKNVIGGKAQYVIPGAERSARQAAEAREAEGHGKIRPKKPHKPMDEGLFAEQDDKQGTLFAADDSVPANEEDASGAIGLGASMPRGVTQRRPLASQGGAGDWDRVDAAQARQVPTRPEIEALVRRVAAEKNFPLDNILIAERIVGRGRAAAATTGEATGQPIEAGGMTIGQVVTLSMRSRQPRYHLLHEFWHAFQRSMTDRERALFASPRADGFLKALAAQAKGWSPDDPRLDEMARPENRHELEAYAYQAYEQNRDAGRPTRGLLPAARRAFERIYAFLKRLAAAVGARRLTPADVFETAATGRAFRRVPPATRQEVALARQAGMRFAQFGLGDTRVDVPASIVSRRDGEGGDKPRFAADETPAVPLPPPFFSALTRYVEGVRQAKATASQWAGMIENAAGVKPEEIKWTGVKDWLEAQGGRTVTKDELLYFLRANEIQVKEVLKGYGESRGWSELADRIEARQGTLLDALDRDGDGGFMPASVSMKPKTFTYDDPDYGTLTVAGATPNTDTGWDNGGWVNVTVTFPDGRMAQTGVWIDRDLAITPYSKGEWETSDVFTGDEVRAIDDALSQITLIKRYASTDEAQRDSKRFDAALGRAAARLRAGDLWTALAALRRAEGIEADYGKDYVSRELFGDLADLATEDIFETYTLPGGENRYGVLLLTLPARFGRFIGPHFSARNVVAHVRFNERTSADGKRVLFIEEIQSDWHQRGRRLGYGSQVPDAPFKTTWPELAFKRMVRWAAENGFDRVAWTTGRQQTERYDLAKQVSAIRYYPPRVGEHGTLQAFAADGRRVIDRVVKSDELTDLIGKTVADRLLRTPETREGEMTRPFHYLADVNLRLGGEGMHGFYDRILPAVASRLGKRFGARVATSEIEVGKQLSRYHVEQVDDQWRVLDEDMREVARFESQAEAEAAAADRNTGRLKLAAVHSMDITPEMRRSALGGFPLFRLEGEARGESAHEIDRIIDRFADEFSRLGVPLQNVLAVPTIMPTSPAAEEALRASGGQPTEPIAGLTIGQIAMVSWRLAPDGTGYHEGIHIIENALRAVAPDHPMLRILERDTERLRALAAQRLGAAAASALTPAEVRAYAGEAYLMATERGQPVATGVHAMIRRFWDAIGMLMRRLSNALRGLGFRTAEDVYEAIGRGEFGRYVQPQQATLEDFTPFGVQPQFATERGADITQTPEFKRRFGNSKVVDKRGRPSIGNRGTFDRADPRINFSVAHDLQAINNVVVNRIRRSRTMDSIREALEWARWQIADRMLPLLRAEQYVEAVIGRPLDPEERPYKFDELYSGRVTARLDRLREDHIMPLLRDLHESGLLRQGSVVVEPEYRMSRFEEYLYARHAKERNARIAEINPEFEPGEGSGMTDEEAQQVVARAKEDGTNDQLEALAKRVWDLLGEARRIRVETGLLSQQVADIWEQRYPHYVPLRGMFELDGDGDIEEASLRPRVGLGYDVRGPESRRAYGRRSRATNILANVIMLAEEAIIRGEKNRVAMSVLDLARTLIEADPKQRLLVVNKMRMVPYYSKTTGLVTYRPTERLTAEEERRTLIAKVNGVEYRITLGNSRMARALKNLDADKMGMVIQFLAAANRFFAGLATSWNPQFIFTNLFRDLQTAAVHLAGTDQKRIVRDVMRDYPKALAGMLGYVRGKQDSEWQLYAREFSLAGGRTGYFKVDDIDAIRTRIDRELRMMDEGAVPAAMRAARTVKQWVEDANAAVENAVRLSTYVNARRRGMSQDEAASLAKNLTVNFNRRGQAGPSLNAVYMFFNAGVQGTATMLGWIARSRTVRRIVLGVMLSGFLMEFLNALLSDRDDDGQLFYDKNYSESDKSKNWILMLGRDAITIPMPWGYNAFHGVGRNIAALLRGNKTAGEAATDIVVGAIDAFNPLSGADLMAYFVPSWAKPMYEVAVNRNWAGEPIAPQKRERTEPESERYFRNVSHISRWLTRQLNKLGGGSEGLPAQDIPWLDISPEYLDYLFGAYTSGLGRFVGRTLDTGTKLLSGEGIEWRDIPIGGTFVRGKPASVDRGAFYDAEVKAATWKDALERAARAGRTAEVAAIQREHAAEIGLYPLAEKIRDRLSAIRQTVEAVRQSDLPREERLDRLRALEEAEEALLMEFNRVWYERVAAPRQEARETGISRLILGGRRAESAAP